MPSATAQQNIPAGTAVAQSGATAVSAGTTLLATHIAQTGSPKGGTVTLLASGNLVLPDWTLAIGSKYLKSGTTYYVGAGGKLVTAGAQPVGIAVAKDTLSITIQSQQASSGSSSSQIAALQAQIAALTQQVTNINLALPKRAVGSLALSSGVNSGTVTGVSAGFSPTRAIPVIRAPSGSIKMFATVIDGTVTSDGFQFALSALTDSINYILDYEMS